MARDIGVNVAPMSAALCNQVLYGDSAINNYTPRQVASLETQLHQRPYWAPPTLVKESPHSSITGSAAVPPQLCRDWTALPEPRSPGSHPCPGRWIPVQDIYDRALALLDSEGAGALGARRLAADLKISTPTGYQQVGTRDQLPRVELVTQHFSRLRLDFHTYDTWESTAWHWCLPGFA